MKRNRAAARLMILRRLLSQHEIGSQEELVKLLGEQGHVVTQATVSRDLSSLGVEKVAGSGGRERYVVAADLRRQSQAIANLGRRLREFVTEIGHSANQVVLKTGPGSASPVAAALDAAALGEILGTIGGDDTILVIARNAEGGAAVAQQLEDIMEAGDR
ncbi:MAG: arginine repressor [Acidobacteriota bacterium]